MKEQFEHNHPWTQSQLEYLRRSKDDFQRLREFLDANEQKRRQLTHEDEHIPGVVIAAGNLYPKIPEIRDVLFGYLEEQGYKVKDCTVPEPGHEQYFDRPSLEVQQREGWYMYYASLRDDVLKRVGKCDSCESYISPIGIQTHGHECECCGEATYDKFPKGSRIGFSLLSLPETAIGVIFTEGGDAKEAPFDSENLRDASLIVESYDPDTKEIYCYGELAEAEKEGLNYGSDVVETYRRLSDVAHVDRIIVNRSDIINVWGSRRNFRIVKLFEDEEYSELDRLPVAESFSIYEPWHWAPLSPTPDLHNKILRASGLVEDKSWYHQDGRVGVYEGNIKSMRRFVDHFTTLNLSAWDQMILRAPRSGPGMIDVVAHFCHSSPRIVNEPNIGNFLIGLADSMAGKPKTKGQLEAELRYLRSEGFNGTVDDLISYCRALGLIPSETDIQKEKERRQRLEDIWNSLDLE